MLQQLFITCILHHAFLGGTFLTNNAEEINSTKPYWKTIIDYQNSLTSEKRDGKLQKEIYWKKKPKTETLSKSMLKKNLKEILRKHKSSDLKPEHNGNFKLTVFKDQLKEAIEMSVLIDSVLFKKPNVKKTKDF